MLLVNRYNRSRFRKRGRPPEDTLFLNLAHMPSSRFTKVSLDLLLDIMELAVQSYVGGSTGHDRAELAELSLVTRIAQELVTRALYGFVVLDAVDTAILFLRTIKNKGNTWTMSHIRALQIVEPAWRDLGITGMHALRVEPAWSTMPQQLSHNIAWECRHAALQVPLASFEAFPSQLEAHTDAVPRQCSVICAINDAINEKANQCLDSVQEKAGYIHLGVPWGEDHAADHPFRYILHRLSSPYAEYVALDWHHSLRTSEFLFESLFDNWDGLSSPIRRLVLRVPFWHGSDNQSNDVCDCLNNEGVGYQAITGTVIAVHRVFLDVFTKDEAHRVMAQEGWRRHVLGVEDLWMSGTPVRDN